MLAVVEIKARFDEQANISWARKLEHSGVHVVYGIVGLKTHAKLSLVVRQEAEGLRRYCHVGTGNYNPKTARLYEDFGLLTCDPQVGEDLSRLFNQLSGFAPRSRFKRLLVAPRTVRSGLIEQIEAETARQQADGSEGGGGYIAIKVNSIVDEALIDALYRASQAGVRVDVWVRGICALRPGVPGLSETIEVRSVLGRFLEHSRVFLFGGGGEPQAFIGSADMMHRNLDRRVEALVRITERAHVAELQSLMARGMSDDDLQLAARRGRPLGAPPPRLGRVAAGGPADRPHRDARQATVEGPPAVTAGAAGAVPPGNPPVLRAAGALPWRHQRGQLQVALVHRPRYDDWAWAKGKLDADEQWPAAAAREVQEETGYTVRLGRTLPTSTYTLLDRTGARVTKEVRYWAAEVIAGDGVLQHEIDEVAWLDVATASTRLDYARDRDQLRALVRADHEGTLATWPLVLVRHAHAAARGTWSGGDDRLRPLDRAGRQRALQIGPLLAAYDVRRVVSSDAVRCADTVAPYAQARGIRLRLRPGLSEEGHQADPAPSLGSLGRLISRARPAALCSHGPVLPGPAGPAAQPGQGGRPPGHPAADGGDRRADGQGRGAGGPPGRQR